MMEPSGKRQIKVTGVIFTVYGVYNLVCVVLLLAGVKAGYRLFYTAGIEQHLAGNPSMVLIMTAVASLIGAGIYLTAGIVGIRLCGRLEKAKVLRNIGMIMFIFTLLGLVGNLFSGSPIFWTVLFNGVEAILWFSYYLGGKKNLDDSKKMDLTLG